MKTILHVEDDLDIARVVRMFLQNKGYKIISASDCKEAIKLLETEKPDLFLLDVMLPDMSGWDFYKELRKKDKKVKVIFLSIVPITDKKIKAVKDKGVADYITKPFEKDDFIRRVDAALKNGG